MLHTFVAYFHRQHDHWSHYLIHHCSTHCRCHHCLQHLLLHHYRWMSLLHHNLQYTISCHITVIIVIAYNIHCYIIIYVTVVTHTCKILCYRTTKNTLLCITNRCAIIVRCYRCQQQTFKARAPKPLPLFSHTST